MWLLNYCLLIVVLSGSSYGHGDGRLSAVHAEHPGGDPLPQDDVAGRDWRRPGNLPHRLHVLLNGESLSLCLHSSGIHAFTGHLYWSGYNVLIFLKCESIPFFFFSILDAELLK